MKRSGIHPVQRITLLIPLLLILPSCSTPNSWDRQLEDYKANKLEPDTNRPGMKSKTDRKGEQSAAMIAGSIFQGILSGGG